jgi:hypothetical protein
METNTILDHKRVRKTHNSFGFIPHRFLRDGFLSALEKDEAYLYLFYILAANQFGVSFYGDRRICEILGFSISELMDIRNHLICKNLICCQDRLCQVLELPPHPGENKAVVHKLQTMFYSALKGQLKEKRP